MYKDNSQLGNHLEESYQDKTDHASSDPSATSRLDQQPKGVTSYLTNSKAVHAENAMMSSNTETSDRVTNEEERAELAAVLATEIFRRSPKLSRLLSYICDKYFAGEEDELKEYSIAVDVLGRDSEFDPQLDAAVRVDTHYLRKRLKDYYAKEARDHRVEIVIPKGRYVPQFLLRAKSGLSAEAQPQEEEDEETTLESLMIAREHEREHPAVHVSNWRWLVLGLGAVTIGSLLWMTIAPPSQRSPKTKHRLHTETI